MFGCASGHGAGCRPSANYCKFAVLVSVAKLRLKCVTLNLHPAPAPATPRCHELCNIHDMSRVCDHVTMAVITQTGKQPNMIWQMNILNADLCNNLHLDLWLVKTWSVCSQIVYWCVLVWHVYWPRETTCLTPHPDGLISTPASWPDLQWRCNKGYLDSDSNILSPNSWIFVFGFNLKNNNLDW